MKYQITQDAFTRPDDPEHFDPRRVVSLMPASSRPDDDGPASDTREAIRAEFDRSEVTPNTAIVETIATAGDRERTALEPLYDWIDPDALDTLIRTRETNSTDSDTTVTFALDGQELRFEVMGRSSFDQLSPARDRSNGHWLEESVARYQANIRRIAVDCYGRAIDISSESESSMVLICSSG